MNQKMHWKTVNRNRIIQAMEEYKNQECEGKDLALNAAKELIVTQSKRVAELEKEIERLKGLIWKAYQGGEDGMIDSVFIGGKGDEIIYSQVDIDRFKNKFKAENNL